MKYGYARVSNDNQKADLQIAAIKIPEAFRLASVSPKLLPLRTDLHSGLSRREVGIQSRREVYMRNNNAYDYEESFRAA